MTDTAGAAKSGGTTDDAKRGRLRTMTLTLRDGADAPSQDEGASASRHRERRRLDLLHQAIPQGSQVKPVADAIEGDGEGDAAEIVVEGTNAAFQLGGVDLRRKRAIIVIHLLGALGTAP